MTDLELVRLAKAGDGAATARLVARFEPMAHAVAARFFSPYEDRDDLRQEATIGVLRAVRTFDPANGTPFRPFAELCVRRWLCWIVRRDTTERQRALNESYRVARDEETGAEIAATELLPARIGDPHHRLVVREEFHAIRRRLSQLTAAEKRAVRGAVVGLSYAEIGEPKSVDNALMRARVKLREAA